MSKTLIGRQAEQEILKEALQSDEAEMVAVVGRRRVGKTFLIKEVYREHIQFEITGLQNATLKKQLQHFSFTLGQYVGSNIPMKEPSNWLEAFQMLVLYMEKKVGEEKCVVFFDELPWLASRRSDFLTGLGFFWNSWAVNKNVVIVICGSAASWMIDKVVNNRGGLHNRITKRIYLQPFSLSETEAFLKNKNIGYKRPQIIEIYMALGGIPHYLKEIKKGKSPVQNIDDICFSHTGFLRDEFDRLYHSLFANADKHIAIIRALGSSHQGLTRPAIVKKAKISEGGNTTKVLKELEQSGFITSYVPFGKKKKNKLYRLTDEYSLFYLRFIEKEADGGSGTWKHLSQTQANKIWSGYAFENICLRHIPQIKKALSIAGIYSKTSTFYKKGTANEKGTQIDLLLDRNDKVINIFEIKYHNSEFTVTENYAKKLKEKMQVFQEATKTRKYLMLVFIAAFGVKSNPHSLGLVEQVVGLEELFEA